MSLFSARANGALPLSVVLLAGLVACTDLEQSEPTEPVPIRTWNQVASRGGAISRFPELVEFVHPVRLSNPGMASDTELTDEQLVEAVARAGGRVLIGFKPASAARTRATGIVPGISRDDALRGRSAIEALGAEITMTYRFTSAVEAVIPAGIAPKLRHLAIVDYVEPAFPAFPTQLTAQDTSWGTKKIRAHFAWAGFGVLPTRGEYANITILDTGLDQAHIWSGSGDGPASMVGCYYADTQTITSCYDDLTNSAIRGHGPHVAGVVASRDNSYGFIGVANDPDRFASIRVCDNSGCPPGSIIGALNYILDSLSYPRHVVNISIGICTNHQALHTALVQLHNAGVLVIASAGNEVPGATQQDICQGAVNNLPNWATSVMYPARYSEVMAVSGTLEQDQFAATYAPLPPGTGTWEPPECGPTCPVQGVSCTNGSGSRAGPEVEIAAPFRSRSMTQNGSYDERCGTSFSAPAVAGVAALLWSQQPSLTAAQVRQRLKSTAVTYLPATQFGSGRVDAFFALQAPSYTATITGPANVRPGATCSFSASTSSPHAPYSYDWAVNSIPAGYSGSFIYHTAGSKSFSISVTVQDGLAGQAIASLPVAVSASAPECLDQ